MQTLEVGDFFIDWINDRMEFNKVIVYKSVNSVEVYYCTESFKNKLNAGVVYLTSTKKYNKITPAIWYLLNTKYPTLFNKFKD